MNPVSFMSGQVNVSHFCKQTGNQTTNIFPRFITTHSARSCSNSANVADNTEIRKMRRRLS